MPMPQGPHYRIFSHIARTKDTDNSELKSERELYANCSAQGGFTPTLHADAKKVASRQYMAIFEKNLALVVGGAQGWVICEKLR